MLLNRIKIFRLVGFLEGLSYLLLIFIAVPLKYWTADDSFVKILGMPHGLLFLLYVFLAFFIRRKRKWSNKKIFIVLLASILPFGTFYVDFKYLK